MCGIAGIIHLGGSRIEGLEQKLKLMNRLISHRGPDDQGSWGTVEINNKINK